jgi:hypothetical protein
MNYVLTSMWEKASIEENLDYYSPPGNELEKLNDE